MNRTEHGIIGALSAFVAYSFHKKIKGEQASISGIFGSLVLGGFAGILPDLLEPASNPNHRSFFHSITLLALLLQGNQEVRKSIRLASDQKMALSLFSIAYSSHIISDSKTPRSIPFLL